MVFRKLRPSRPLWIFLAAAVLLPLLPAAPVSAAAWDEVGSGPSDPNTGIDYSYARLKCINGAGYREVQQPDGSWKVDMTGPKWTAPFSQCVNDICPGGPFNCTNRNATIRPTIKLLCTGSRIKVVAGTGETPPCPDNTMDASAFKYCQTHWEVWRFYAPSGTAAPTYWTLSRTNLSDWCQDAAPMTVYSPNPYDAGYNARPSASNPFVGTTGTNRFGETFYVTHPAASTNGPAFTTAPPFRVKGSGSCDPNRLRTATNPYAQGTPWAEKARNDLFNQFKSQRAEVTARSMANMNASGGWDDGIMCSSGAEYAVSAADIARGVLTPAYGTCWIPVQRALHMFSDANGRTVYNALDITMHRYQSLPRKSDHPTWRSVIYDEIRSRPGPMGVPTNSNYRSEMWTPGDPYNPFVNPAYVSSNRTAAAQAAAQGATCVDGPLSATDSGPETITIPLTGTVNLPNRTITGWSVGSCATVSDSVDSTFDGCVEYAKLGSTYQNSAFTAAQNVFNTSAISGPGVYDLGQVYQSPEITVGTNVLLVQFTTSLNVSGTGTPPPPDEGPCPGACDGVPPPRPAGATPSIIYTMIVPRNFNTGAAMRTSQKVTVVAHGLDTARLCPATNTRTTCSVSSLSMNTTLTGENGFTQFKKNPTSVGSSMLGCTAATLRAAFSPNSTCKQEFTMDLYRATESGQGIRASVTGAGTIAHVTTFSPLTVRTACLLTGSFNYRTRTCQLNPNVRSSNATTTVQVPAETNLVNLRIITRIIFSEKAYGPTPDRYTSMLSGLNCTGRPRCAVRPVIASTAVGS
jgi:hypothetical protein